MTLAANRSPAVADSPDADRGLTRVLAEALQVGEGEVIFRQEAVVGRVLLTEGKVAWAHISEKPEAKASTLQALTGLETGEVELALEESRRRSRSPIDVLLDWELVAADDLREWLLAWIRRQLVLFRRFSEAEALFLPIPHTHSRQSLTYALDEVLPAEVDLPVRRLEEVPEPAAAPGEEIPQATDDDLTQRARALLTEVEGARWIGLLSRSSSTMRLLAVAECDDLPLGLLHSIRDWLQHVSTQPVDEVVVTSSDTLLFHRRLEASADFLIVGCDPDVVFGAAWLAVRALATELGEARAH